MSKIIIANWKMYLSHEQALSVSKALVVFSKRVSADKKIVICPSYISFKDVIDIFKGTQVSIGAQDIFWEERGAYTGEVSALDIKTLGGEYALLGHSERRKNFNETNKMIHDKTRICLENGLIPVLCIGEDWDQKKNGQRDYVLIQQLNEVLEGIAVTNNQKIIIAYEPVWAISAGGGVHASPEEVNYVQKVIRQVLLDLYGNFIINDVFKIIYGGSVTPENVKEYTEIQNISGVLVGSASTNADAFYKLINVI